MRVLFSLCFLLTLSACTTAPVNEANPIAAMSRPDYAQLIKKNTRHTDQYSGLYQTFQADVTILTSEIQTEGLKQKALFLQWTPGQYQQEREKLMQEGTAYAKFFMRFFSPEREYDDLQKPNSIWKVYLEFSGNRFEGRVKRLTDKLIEIETVYPHMDRFSTPYEVTFNIPMATVEGGNPKMVLTSSLGHAEFVFPLSK